MIRKTVAGFFVCLACLLPLMNTTEAARRTALVIGNSNYTATAPLQNPVNDARDMAEALRELGFKVICKLDAGREEMDKAVQDFFRNLSRVQVGFFYYSGHGLQINGINYLLPVDICVSSPADIKHRAIKADWVLSKMEDSGSKVNIVVLDACRDNPFRGLRSLEGGLAPIQSVRGSFIAYATSPGSVASDGSGRNGVYTTHLLRNIKRQGLTVEEVFREVRKGVAESTDYKQIPWDSSSLMGAFYLAGAGSGRDDAERRLFEEEQARLERERRELEQARVEFEHKQREAKQERIEVASIPQRPSSFHPSTSTPNITDRDGVYVAYANGIVRDTSTGLEWKAGPDTDMTWDDARSWVQSLGGDWRMPTMDELAGLYKYGAGDRNMTPLLKTNGYWVWAGETKGSSPAWYFDFGVGERGWLSSDFTHLGRRAFAVRSGSD